MPSLIRAAWDEYSPCLAKKLPFRYREVIVLYYYEEYGTGEIAKMLHTSVNTVKSRLRRGREKLAAIMKN